MVAVLSLFVYAVSIKGAEPRRLTAKNPAIRSIRILQQNGARPRFSRDGLQIVFDRKNADGYYQVFISDLNGRIVRSVTEGQPGVGQRNNGNAIFHPSGRYVVFTSEADRHLGERIKALGDPGVGLFSNFWALDLESGRFTQLTHIPIKERPFDRIPAMASANPLFTPDGRTFMWTQRYAEGGHNKWGVWRVMAALFHGNSGEPSLSDERVFITPGRGNYVTEMAFLSPTQMLVAGNLDGQHEYGMDQYAYNFKSGAYVNLTNTPEVWDEDSCVAPNGSIIWMSNQDSHYKFDFSRANWAEQPVTREYYMMDREGHREQLTHFNDPDAPEYLGHRVLVAACHVSPDGRYLAGTLGIDHGTGNRRENVELKVVLVEFSRPLSPGN
jgi:hypothetical protein